MYKYVIKTIFLILHFFDTFLVDTSTDLVYLLTKSVNLLTNLVSFPAPDLSLPLLKRLKKH